MCCHFQVVFRPNNPQKRLQPRTLQALYYRHINPSPPSSTQARAGFPRMIPLSDPIKPPGARFSSVRVHSAHSCFFSLRLFSHAMHRTPAESIGEKFAARHSPSACAFAPKRIRVALRKARVSHARSWREKALPRPSCLTEKSEKYTALRGRRRGREAEGGGLLNRYTGLYPYRGFESLRLRHFYPQSFLSWI